MKTIYLVMEYPNDIMAESSIVVEAWSTESIAEERCAILNTAESPYFHYLVEEIELDATRSGIIA